MEYEKPTLEVLGSAAAEVRGSFKISDDPDGGGNQATTSAYEADE